MCLSDDEAFLLKDKKIILAWNIIIALFKGHISSFFVVFFRSFILRVIVVLFLFSIKII